MSAMSNQIDDGGPAYPHVEVDAKTGEVTNHNGMSLRAYAAIQLRVPSSGIDWLDDMIIEAKRDELAGQALAGLLAKLPLIDQKGEFGIKVDDKDAFNRDVAESCFALADAMLSADCSLAARKEKP